MRRLLYSVKNWVQRSPFLYGLIFNTMTRNDDYRAQMRERDQYKSRFGGMWTDRKDFIEKLGKKARHKHLKKSDIDHLVKWRHEGYAVLPQAIPHDLIDRYKAELDQIMAQHPSPLLMTSYDAPEPVPYTEENAEKFGSVRVVDDYMFSEYSREILFHPDIIRFLDLAFEKKPILTQTLRFDYGSEQPLHQDTAFVRMNSPMKLVGVWVALEDIKLGSGELMYLPGSHNWEGHLFSGRFKHYDAKRDGPEDLTAWHQWILDEAKTRGVETETFLAKKGDVFFWHAGLAHGGAPRVTFENTRLSLVAHFCPEGVKPLYHYYKRGQRAVKSHHGLSYMSSYYR